MVVISTAEAQAPPGARAGQAAGKKDWASNLTLTPRHQAIQPFRTIRTGKC
jgi:hypothetical protein